MIANDFDAKGYIEITLLQQHSQRIVIANTPVLILFIMKLNKEELAKYVITNTHYYEKYLEKLHTKSRFISWNWAAFLIPQLWLPYRKLWGYFLVLFTFYSCALLASGFFLFSSYDTPPILVVLTSFVTLAFIIYVSLYANWKFLYHAHPERRLWKNGKSSGWIIGGAAIVFSIPLYVFLYALNQVVIKENNAILIQRLGHADYNHHQVIEILHNMPNEHLTSDVAQIIACRNHPASLDLLQQKDIAFDQYDLLAAYRCNAVKSVLHMIQQGSPAQQHLFERIIEQRQLVQHAIAQKNTAMVKALLDKKETISQLLLSHAIAGDTDNADQDLLEFLLAKTHDITKPEIDENGEVISALSTAAQTKNLKWTERLLQAGANPNIAVDQYNHNSLLAVTVASHNEEVITLLLKYKADPNFSPNENTSQILERAVRTNNPHIVRQILVANAKVTKEVLSLSHQLLKTKKRYPESFNDQERKDSEKIIKLLKQYKNI